VKSNPYRIGTKRFEIAAKLIAGISARETYLAFRPYVLDQTEPFIFRANVGGSRRAKAIHDQIRELRFEVNRVAAKLEIDDFLTDDLEESFEEIHETQAEEKEMPSDGKRGSAEWIKAEKAFFLREIRRIRAWCEERAKLADPVDHISMRPVTMAKRGIPVGIPARALLHAMAMHWSDETRREAGIQAFDFEALSQEELKARKLDGKGFHKLMGYVLLLAEARIPIQLVGPAGGGKSHLAIQLAEILFGDSSRASYVPMTAGATPSWLIGSWTIDGFRTRPFLEMFSGGGVFIFEEMDAGDPNLLLVANNALASDTFHNPINGEAYSKHEDFIPVSTANTYGMGANRQYSARERLDLATIDRWRMGRVFVPIDSDLEAAILN